MLFSKNAGCMESNEVEVVVILKTLRFLPALLVVQSDLLNAIS